MARSRSGFAFVVGATFASGCAGRVYATDPDAGSDATSDTPPPSKLAEHPLAAFCDAHLDECEAYYPKCETIRSRYWDEDRTGGGVCWSDTARGPTPYPVVQCVPRSEPAGYTEWAAGYDRVVDPRTGHCVAVPMYKYSPRWTRCDAWMPACKPGPVGGCVKGNPPDTTCWAACNTSADCTDPAKPHCSMMGLLVGGDFLCNSKVRVCRSSPLDECP